MGVGVWQVCLPLLALLASLAQGSVTCPKECSKCTGTKVECPNFTLTLKDKHLDVRCNWRYDIYGSAYIKAYYFSDMAANSIKGLPFYDQLTFAKCAIPENRSLSDTLSMLGPLTNMKKLFFVENVDSAPLESVLFEGLDSLEILSLKNVTQHPIEASDLFKNIPHLKWLDLRQYDGDSLPADLLRPLQALKTLEYQQNAYIKELPPGWLSNLPQLDNCVIYGNGLTRLERFVGLPKLKKLSMRSNQLEELPEDLFSELPQLIELDMQRNHLTSLPDKLFGELTQLEMLDLSHNKLPLIPDTLLQNQSQLRSLNLGYNQLTSLNGFMPNLQTVDLSHNAIESLQFKQVLKWTKVSEVSLSALECDYIERDCPAECACQIRPEDGVLTVDCSARNLTTVPMLHIPQDNKYRAFELRLEDNLLETLPDKAVMSAWEMVHRLNVSNNRLDSLEVNNLPIQLQMLDVSGNRLRAFGEGVAQQLKHLQNVHLKANPWECTCGAEVLNFVQANSTRITDFEAMRCEDGETITMNLQNELCDNQWKVVAAICGIVAVFLAIAVVLVSFCYRYQHEVKVWLFTHNWLQWLTSEEELDKDKVYDAFVSYSHKDEEFITDFLVPKLESAPMNFRVCWHVRDFMPGEMISTQITKAVENSRRTIIVLSANYLESVWGQMEFKTAYLQSIEDKRNRVIAIIYDDIGNVEDLDQELRAYLRTNTYLRWGDPWFWDKLRYAMPHPKRVKGMQINNNMRHHIATIDKLELIKTLQNGRAPAGDGDASPAQESTPPIEHVVKEIDGPLAKLYAPPAPVFTISTAKLDLHAPE
ncbi:hypothetical protein ZHAS_00020302 [Anopheles sinensis]|uniref:TIR domain-containing protein n=1 Tax=Anopheles sinensis TaxID=74873 RepID=A0A084WPQ1_ANOSI|nr:hypothetical protein ZHAS_00020302 [Anopheles sinensis]